MKFCKSCNIKKPLSEFYKMSKSKDGFRYECKQCENDRKKNWTRLNSDRLNELQRLSDKVYSQYGITKADYDRILVEQNGVCKICKNPETRRDKRSGLLLRLCIDHCHETGKVRGLLCFRCNTVLGSCKDDVKLMMNMINYLEDNE